MSTETLTLVVGAALVIALLSLLLSLWLLVRTRRLAAVSAFRPETPASLQAALEREVERFDSLARSVEDLRARLPTIERQAASAVQHVGIVRYNPFADTGGQQSFAVALLDARGNGFVMSSLHSRQQTRVYLKQVVEGRCDTALSEEEAQALRQAGAAT